MQAVEMAAAPAGQSRLMNLVDVISFCQLHALPADVVGRWVWLRFDSKPAEAIRDLLKAAGFRWVKRRGEWAHNCGHPSRHGSAAPRWKYGAVPVAELGDVGGEGGAR